MPQKTAPKNHWSKSKKSWKSVQADSKQKQQTKLGLLILGLILLVVLFGKIIQLAANFYQPLDIGANIAQPFYWNGVSSVNILFHGDHYGVVSYSPADKTIKIINIPEDTSIPVANEFGNWQIRSIYGLGESEEKPQGNKLLQTSVSNLLGIPIEGYIQLTGKNKSLSILAAVEVIKKSPFGFITATNEIKSNMTIADLMKVTWDLGRVRFDKVTEIDLEKRGVLERNFLPDKTAVLNVDYSQLDNLIQSLADSNLINEDINVAIFNATTTPGLAQKYARFVSNLGINVITVANAGNNQPKTIVLKSKTAGEDVQNSATLERLAHIFSSDCSKGLNCDIIDCNSKSLPVDCQVHDSQVDLSRAQINIIIGEDFVNKY